MTSMVNCGWLCVVGMIMLVGCGGPGNSCGASGTGVTECFTGGGTTCSAGQFCDQSSGINTCTAGCTSDSNCSSGDSCVRASGDAIGVCTRCAPISTVDAPRPPPPPPGCGDGVCSPGESCELDCFCGDGICQSNETPTTCPPDCVQTTCGNGICDTGETQASCAQDCVDPTLMECKTFCDAYDFFQCFAPGQLQRCYDACTASTPAQRTQFDNCAGVATASCDTSCLAFLPSF